MKISLQVVGFCANQGNEFGEGLDGVDIAVCTIEKGNAILNRLIEQKELSLVCVVVVDEIHMIGDGERGYVLELFLTKLRFCASHCQIVGMSATLPNLVQFGEWLDAHIFRTDIRPVPLLEMVKIGDEILSKDFRPIRSLAKIKPVPGDTEKFVFLCAETVANGYSVLVFCSSRKGCESCCEYIAKHLDQYLQNMFEKMAPSETVHPLHYSAKKVAARSLIHQQLKKMYGGEESVLSRVVCKGIAFHHAGMTVEEREMIEMGFREGTISILVATSTLAAGVNLPVRRVIFRTAYIGSEFLDSYRYRQMSGRAGRKGIDELGESILILKSADIEKAKSHIFCQLPSIQSTLSSSMVCHLSKIESKKMLIIPF